MAITSFDAEPGATVNRGEDIPDWDSVEGWNSLGYEPLSNAVLHQHPVYGQAYFRLHVQLFDDREPEWDTYDGWQDWDRNVRREETYRVLGSKGPLFHKDQTRDSEDDFGDDW